MAASNPSSNRRCLGAGMVLAACALAGASACTETLDPIEGTTSLRVELLSPTDTGGLDDRLDDSLRSVTIQVTALDTQAELDTSFSGTVDIYSHYLGGLTPELGQTPLATLDLAAGQSGQLTFDLPLVYGPTFLWVEHTRGDDATFATGTSPLLWYRDPFLVDVSRPVDEGALDAMEASPLEKKQINVTGSRYGERGRMVVTGIYAQGYTLSDVECGDADGTPPCVTDAYDSVFVFSFNRPRGEEGESVEIGHAIERLTGSIAEFNGLTEVNFPQSFVSNADPDQALVPEPIPIDPGWLDTLIEMERVEAALIEVVDAELCPLDADFETYAQWKLAVGGDCGDRRGLINVITRGQVNDFDPAGYVGEIMPSVVGTLRPVNIGSFHVWIMYPRAIGDITLP